MMEVWVHTLGFEHSYIIPEQSLFRSPVQALQTVKIEYAQEQ